MADELLIDHVILSWEGKPVVEDVTMQVAAGQLACLVGRSGTGKTTLFHAIAGLTTPERGHIYLGATDVTGKAGRIAYMLQKDLLLPWRTVLDNVILPLILKGVPKAEARAEALELFERFGIKGTEASYPAQLSGGMRQRAALLRTYLQASPVLLLDEPFSALDALTRTEMRAWFLQMVSRFNLTCMLVTHDVDEALAMADVIYVLDGNPQAGVPSRIVGSVSIDTPRETRSEFLLTQAALAKKREVLALLGAL